MTSGLMRLLAGLRVGQNVAVLLAPTSGPPGMGQQVEIDPAALSCAGTLANPIARVIKQALDTREPATFHWSNPVLGPFKITIDPEDAP